MRASSSSAPQDSGPTGRGLTPGALSRGVSGSARDVVTAVPAAVAFVLYVVWSVTRHEEFGSGSWDLGCYNHNAWLFAHGRAFSTSAISSVLDDAAFWGGTNHFMPSLVLTAPLSWFMEATHTSWALLVAQAALVAGAGWMLARLAREAGLGAWTSSAISIAFLFHTGVQNAVNFDVHEIAAVPLCLFVALWAASHERRAAFWVSALVLAGTKESALVYTAALGVWLVVAVPRLRIDGAVLACACLVGFWLVTAKLQPALLEPGSHGMIHVGRFASFGTTPTDVASGILGHPWRALTMLFTPAPKAATLALTTGSFAFLPLASPAAWLLVAPNLAERFLSDKREMWGLGFHYSLVTVACCAWGALQVLARARRHIHVHLVAFDRGACALLVTTTLACATVAAPFPPELAQLHKSYAARDHEVERYRRALAMIPDDAAVVAQNHFLPHLAVREHIWQPHPRFLARAQWVVLDANASPWPLAQRDVARTIRALLRAPDMRVAFSEGTTVVFERSSAPSVAVDPALPVAVGEGG